MIRYWLYLLVEQVFLFTDSVNTAVLDVLDSYWYELSDEYHEKLNQREVQ